MIIAYENQSALTRAEELQIELKRRCQSEVEIESSAWNFALLGNLQLRKHAAAEAMDADMIVVAASASSALPLHVGAWLKCILPRDKQAALVVLIDPNEGIGEEKSPIAASLRRFAEANNLDFFCNLDDWPATAEQNFPWNRQDERREMTLGAFCG